MGLGLVRPAFALMLRLSLSTVFSTAFDIRFTRLGVLVGAASWIVDDCISGKPRALSDVSTAWAANGE